MEDDHKPIGIALIGLMAITIAYVVYLVMS